MPIQAVVFDMDGVLVDTEFFYREQLQRFFSKNGIEVPLEALNAQVGQSHPYYLAFLQKWWEHGTGERLAGPVLERMVAEQTADVPVDYAALLNPGVPETLDALRARGYRVALASSSKHDNIAQVLGACGLTGRFELIVSGEDFTESKPNPEIYLHTVAALGLPAEACAAVEDSDVGITAARRAGLTVIAKREERFALTQEGADCKIDAIPDLLPLLERLG